MARRYVRDKEGQFASTPGSGGEGSSKVPGSPVKSLGGKTEFYAQKVGDGQFAIRTPDGKKIGHIEAVTSSTLTTAPGSRIGSHYETKKGFVPVTSPPTPSYKAARKVDAARELERMIGQQPDPKFPQKRVRKPGTFED